MISITLKLFAVYQDTLGSPDLTMTLPEGTTVQELCERICDQHPSLKPRQGLPLFEAGVLVADALAKLLHCSPFWQGHGQIRRP